MRAILIDDEKRARMNLSILLDENCTQVEIVAECENLPEGIKAIRRLKPDLVFLDIEMPGHSGLELLDFFDEHEVDFSIVFTTAYNEYAIQAFKLSAVDYLLKPINPDELVRAVQRVEKHKHKLESYKLLKTGIQNNVFEKIAVPTGNLILFLTLNDIMYIKGDGAYSDVYLQDKSKHTVSRNLKNFEEIICSNSSFIRVHKSFIVNLTYVKAFNKSDGGSLDMLNGFQIPVSPDKAASILDKIQLIRR